MLGTDHFGGAKGQSHVIQHEGDTPLQKIQWTIELATG